MSTHPGTATRTLEEFRGIAEKLSYDPGSGTLVWMVRPAIGVPAGSAAGYLNSHGYLCVSHKRKTFMSHRVAWFIHYGEMPPSKVDHIDGNPLNNRIGNLRDGSGGVNEWNSRRNRGKDLPKGVSRSATKSKPYMAQIWAGGRRQFLGHFETVEEAHAAYCMAAIAHRPAFAVRFD